MNNRQIKVFLAASVPCKRFDFFPLNDDGLGGWTFSQFGSDRYTSSPMDFGIKLGLAVCVEPAIEHDFIEYSIVRAQISGQEAGKSKLDWKIPNNGGVHHGIASVYEWVQDIDLPIKESCLVQLTVIIKLASADEEIEASGSSFVHVSVEKEK